MVNLIDDRADENDVDDDDDGDDDDDDDDDSNDCCITMREIGDAGRTGNTRHQLITLHSPPQTIPGHTIPSGPILHPKMNIHGNLSLSSSSPSPLDGLSFSMTGREGIAGG